jgi:Protein of unknown function (DUF2723)
LVLRLGGKLAVAIAFVVPLVVLLATVRTSVGFWDTGDLQTVAWIAGIPYPTGYPLYVIVGWIWTHALPLASVAARLNALSAVAIAAGSSLVCATALLLDVAAILAIAAGWTFAFAHTIWYRATYADVHPLGFVVAFAAIALAVRWQRRGEERALMAAIVLAGVAVALDNTTVLILVGGAIIALARRPPLRQSAIAIAAAALIVVIAYAYLPLRSAQVTAARIDPTLALGVPPGRPFWDDHHPSTVDGFRALVTGTEWSAGSALAHILSLDALRKTEDRFGPELATDLPASLVVIAGVGLAFAAVNDAIIVLGLVIAALLPALFGATYPPEADPERYSFMLYAVVVIGVALAFDRAIRSVIPARVPIATGIAVAAFALTIGLEISHAGDLLVFRIDTEAADMASDVAANTADGAVVVAPWDYATPLAYRAYVEHAFGRRIVLVGFPEDYTDGYADWLQRGQVAIVAKKPPSIPGFRARVVHVGDPSVYELLPR